MARVHQLMGMAMAMAMATKARRQSKCRYCQRPIGLSLWSGWVELGATGSYDMCPGTISGVHEPIERMTS